jgi:hypothetical protein
MTPELPRALRALANKGSGHRGWASPSGQAGDHRRQASSTVIFAGRAPDVPKHRFTAVTHGQRRSVPTPADLEHRPAQGGRRMLPKLAVLVLLGPAGLGIADRRLPLV